MSPEEKFTRIFWDIFYYWKQRFFCNLSSNDTIQILIKVEITWSFNLQEMAKTFSTFSIPLCSKKLNVLYYKLQCTVFHLSSTQLWKKITQLHADDTFYGSLKVIYPKYTLNIEQYLLAYTMYFDCSDVLIQVLFMSLFKFLANIDLVCAAG